MRPGACVLTRVLSWSPSPTGTGVGGGCPDQPAPMSWPHLAPPSNRVVSGHPAQKDLRPLSPNCLQGLFLILSQGGLLIIQQLQCGVGLGRGTNRYRCGLDAQEGPWLCLIFSTLFSARHRGQPGCCVLAAGSPGVPTSLTELLIGHSTLAPGAGHLAWGPGSGGRAEA